MASSQNRVPATPCAVCQRTDQIMRLPAAYEAGLSRFGPPAMPVAKVSMMKYILAGFVLITVGEFFSLLWIRVGGYGDCPTAVQIIPSGPTLYTIVTTLYTVSFSLLRFNC